MNTIVEQIIIAAARQLTNDYIEWCAADESFDCGEFSGVERTVPPEVMAASELLMEECEQ